MCKIETKAVESVFLFFDLEFGKFSCNYNAKRDGLFFSDYV